MTPRLASVIWAAGFFDGEGCIGILHRKDQTQSYVMNISVGQKDPAPLHIFRTLFGGTVCQAKRATDPRYGCDMWIWRIANRKAEMVLRELEPYLVVKKEQALLALTFQARRLTPKTRIVRELAAEQRVKDEVDLQRMKALKRTPIALPDTIQ